MSAGEIFGLVYATGFFLTISIVAYDASRRDAWESLGDEPVFAMAFAGTLWWIFLPIAVGSLLGEWHRDSGSDRNGEDPAKTGAECEASQSGAAKTAHRPNTSTPPSQDHQP